MTINRFLNFLNIVLLNDLIRDERDNLSKEKKQIELKCSRCN